MNTLTSVFLLVDALAALMLPRRWVALPILLATCFVPLGPELQAGPLHFPVLRIIIAVALLRLIFGRERLPGGVQRLDLLLLVWATCALVTTTFHAAGTLVNRLGLVYNACGIYFLFRYACSSWNDWLRVCRIIALLLFAVSLEMAYEKSVGHSLFAAFGGIADNPEIRNGTIRAQGAFAHSILAGTVGAACLPLAISLWRQFRVTSIVGILGCSLMVVTSGSSSPLIASMFAIAALLAWPARRYMRLIRWLAVLGYIALDAVMNAPAYYILSYIDLTGSSTSWHRAALIEAAIDHFPEWWLAGTDYTRHWLPYGVLWSGDNVDITNNYLRMGVDGGLPLMLAFIGIIVAAFSAIGAIRLRMANQNEPAMAFLAWTIGASLLTHVVSFISVSYFDQSIVFFYLALGAIGSLSARDRISTAALRRAHERAMPTRYDVPSPLRGGTMTPGWERIGRNTAIGGVDTHAINIEIN
jgi:hypothetical protein